MIASNSLTRALILAYMLIVPATAQVSYGLVPGMVTEEFVPGQAFSSLLQFYNGTSAPVVMRGVAMDLWYDEQNRRVFAPANSMPRSATDWIEFVPKVITVAPGETAQVKLVVTPPSNAQGGYYSVAFLESKPELAEPAQNGKQALFTNIRLGALVLFTARGTEVHGVDVSEVAVTPPSGSRALSVDLTVRNKGNVHEFPRSSIVVLDETGQVRTKAKGEVKRLLPGQAERLSVSSAEVLAPGGYEALLSIVFGKDQAITKSVRFQVEDSVTTAAPKPAERTGGVN